MNNHYSPNPIVEVQAYAVPVDSQIPGSFDRQASAPIASINNDFNEGGARDVLSQCKWPVGLQDTFVKNLSKFPIRFFVCDDSGSMSGSDGHKLVDTTGGNKKLISCSRWSELTESLRFHANVSRAACAPTEFRLLNGAPPIMIGTNDSLEHTRYQSLMAIFEQSPSGGTPLCYHINQIINQIRAMEHQLRAANQKACVVIFTDGESSDGDVATAMRPLQSLPVWVVIRLCTDDDKIVEYWNNIDRVLELDMDVLDDLYGEAKEVQSNNPWLTYADPLHRLREFGIHTKEMDLLDESKLSLEQIRIFCSLIFGGSVNSYPHPEADWAAFLSAIQTANNSNGTVWSPVDKTNKEWVNIKKLNNLRPGNTSCSIC